MYGIESDFEAKISEEFDRMIAIAAPESSANAAPVGTTT